MTMISVKKYIIITNHYIYTLFNIRLYIIKLKYNLTEIY